MITFFSTKINSIIKYFNPWIDSILNVNELMICYRSKYICVLEYQPPLNVDKINRWATNEFQVLQIKNPVCAFLFSEENAQ